MALRSCNGSSIGICIWHWIGTGICRAAAVSVCCVLPLSCRVWRFGVSDFIVHLPLKWVLVAATKKHKNRYRYGHTPDIVTIACFCICIEFECGIGITGRREGCRCPHCGANNERYNQNNHVTCRNCRQKFCFQCRAPVRNAATHYKAGARCKQHSV